MASSIASTSSVTSRLERLNELLHAIKRHKGRTAAFNALHLQDRIRILGILNITKFDWTAIEKQGLKGRIKKELQIMSNEAQALSAQPVSGFSFPFVRVPKTVMTTIVSPYLTAKDLVALHRSCKVASEWQSASHIIKLYRLEPLIETYLHSSCAGLTESAKIKLLDALMTFAYNLGKIEKLPRPDYRSLIEFFKLVEARNLIRMIRKLKIEWRLTSLDKTVKSLGIPKNPKQVIKKAELLKGWFTQRQNFLTSVNGRLDLDDCDLSLLPKEIGKLQSLKDLNLNGNHLVTLPKEIGLLQALESLSLSNNHLTSLPKEICQLCVLKELWIDNNRLVILPKEIGLLQALESLILSNNRLAILPKEIGKLRALEGFNVSNNLLNKLPEEIGELEALEGLDASNNRLATLPKEIELLRALRYLDVSYNRFTILPKEIGLLQALEDLDVSHNRLVILPKEIGRLQALEGLIMSNNLLNKLPEEIGLLQALGNLDMSNNRFAILPKEIGRLKSLEVLYLNENGLIELPVGLEIFNDQLKEQNTKLQLKTLLDRLMLCLKNGHDYKGISAMLAKMEEFQGTEIRSKLEHSLYEVCKKSPKTHTKLRAKLKDPLFSQSAFTDEEIDPKFKAVAIAQFWKANKKTAFKLL